MCGNGVWVFLVQASTHFVLSCLGFLRSTFNPFCVILSVGEWCLVFIFVLDLQSILCSSYV